MKKIILVTVIVCLVFSFSVSTSAQTSSTGGYTYDFNGKTFYFSADTPFSEEQRVQIINSTVSEAPTASTYGLMCTLFGHSYETDTYITVTHCVNTSQPRCLEETFNVNLCTRCDHTETELVSKKYIVCCE